MTDTIIRASVVLMKLFTTDDVLAELRKRVAANGQKWVAVDLGLSSQFINDVLRGRREMSKSLAMALGYERKVYFERAK